MISRFVIKNAHFKNLRPLSNRNKLLHSNGDSSNSANLSTSMATLDLADNTESSAANKPRLSEDFRRTFCTPELEDVLQSFPPKLLNRKHNIPETMYIAHPRAADIVAEHLLKNHNRDTTFVEINPGVGLLTQRIIEANVEDVRLFEGTREMLPALHVRVFSN